MRTWWRKLKRRGYVDHVPGSGSEGVTPVPLADLLREHPGQWVAVKRGEVVEAAESPGLLVQRLHDREIRDATIVRAPFLNEPDLVGLG